MAAIRGWAGLSQGAPLSQSHSQHAKPPARKPCDLGSTQLHPKPAGPAKMFPSRINPYLLCDLRQSSGTLRFRRPRAYPALLGGCGVGGFGRGGGPGGGPGGFGMLAIDICASEDGSKRVA
jgi:hypothetical protein